MIYVHLINNDYRYEVNELIRVFYFNEEIVFLDDLKDYSEGFLIVVGLKDVLSFTKVYKDNELLS